jgi:predicted nucleic acid-binding protein
MSGSFADSNVLLYLTSSDTAKADRATELLRDEGVTISVQVINECAYVLRRKFRRSWSDVRDFLDGILPLVSVRPLAFQTSMQGLRLAERYGLSVWDGIIVASALESDAEVLWTEDLHDGLVVDGRLRIANPIASRG